VLLEILLYDDMIGKLIQIPPTTGTAFAATHGLSCPITPSYPNKYLIDGTCAQIYR
jgi:hypothetical protein